TRPSSPHLKHSRQVSLFSKGILHAAETYFAQPCLSSGLTELPLQLYNFLFERPDIGQRRRLVVMTFVFIGNARCTSRLTTIAFGLLFEFSICGIDVLSLENPPFSADSRRKSIYGVYSWKPLSVSAPFRRSFLPVNTSSCFSLIRCKLVSTVTYDPRGRGCASFTT